MDALDAREGLVDAGAEDTGADDAGADDAGVVPASDATSCSEADQEALLDALVRPDPPALCIGPGTMGDPATTGASYCDTTVAACSGPACALSVPGTTFMVAAVDAGFALTASIPLDAVVPLDARIAGVETACGAELRGPVIVRVVFQIVEDGTVLRAEVSEVSMTNTVGASIASGCAALMPHAAEVADHVLPWIGLAISEYVGRTTQPCGL
jgi:hypothetical protein